MVRNARIKITIGGQLRPYTDAHWVMFDSKGFPTGFMRVERRHLRKVDFAGSREADDLAAFADFFEGGPRTPLQAAMDGYTIRLIPDEEIDGLMRQHLGKETEGEKERQHDD